MPTRRRRGWDAPDGRRHGPRPVAEAMTASAGIEGDTVVYTYPRKVDVASGVADLRLPLDVVTFAPMIEARAVPRWDTSAFVMASFVNGE